MKKNIEAGAKYYRSNWHVAKTQGLKSNEFTFLATSLYSGYVSMWIQYIRDAPSRQIPLSPTNGQDM